jgi:uncharacterized protein with ParB-like and HNH nuclease domain
LFEDIVQAYYKQKPHFCSSIVYSDINLGQKIDNYIIIDGQQRLTTIYILLKALLDSATEEIEQDPIIKTIFNVDKFDQYAIDVSTKLKLKPVKSNNNQLLLLMDNKYDELDRNSDIWKNYDLFSHLIKNELDKGMTIPQIYNGLEWLMVAKIRLENDDQPQEIFERINSTGLPLSLSDKIRNFILMTDEEQERLYEEYWLNIENILKNNQMDTFFIDYLYFKVDGFPKENEAYDVFKKMFKSQNYSHELMLKELLHYAEYYGTFLYGNDKYSPEINLYLDGLRKLKQTTLFMFLFRVFDDFENDVIDSEELVKVLRFLQNYSIRRLICEIGSNSLRGLYKTLYSRIFNVEENKQHYYDSVVSFFMQLTSRDMLPDNQMFLNDLKHSNLYRKNALCKFLLSTIENQGKEKIITNNLTIEHIMPQNRNLSTSWQKMLGENWQEVQDTYMHTLGNLTLTGYNSELGDKPFLNKKAMLEENVTKIIRLYSDVKDKEEWNRDTIEKRALRLANEIIELFPIENPKQLISFVDPRYKEYTCEEPDNATNKTPNYYVLLGERVVVSNFADMLKSVVMKLYELDSNVIKQMARNGETIAEWSKIVMFSYDSNIVKGDYVIPNTNIYESVGFSAWYILWIIKLLIEKYELSYDDFVYSARSTRE